VLGVTTFLLSDEDLVSVVLDIAGVVRLLLISGGGVADVVVLGGVSIFLVVGGVASFLTVGGGASESEGVDSFCGKEDGGRDDLLGDEERIALGLSPSSSKSFAILESDSEAVVSVILHAVAVVGLTIIFGRSPLGLEVKISVSNSRQLELRFDIEDVCVNRRWGLEWDRLCRLLADGEYDFRRGRHTDSFIIIILARGSKRKS